MNLLQPDEPTEARVELVPGKVQNLTIGMISLEDRDIYQYIDEPSPMAKYVIDESYLVNVTVPKLQ
ncbi:hypothetical protein [Daejeonella lutea]|nr:hypothetical protein [Daejeonella lutea]